MPWGSEYDSRAPYMEGDIHADDLISTEIDTLDFNFLEWLNCNYDKELPEDYKDYIEKCVEFSKNKDVRNQYFEYRYYSLLEETEI